MSPSSFADPPKNNLPSHDLSSRKRPVTRQLPVNMLLVENRIRSFMEHSTRYAFKSEARLAKDCGVSDAAICRLLVGYSSPSFAMICKLTAAFEKEFGKRIDPRELAAIDGQYPTPTVCEIVGCRGCMPQSAYDDDDILKPEYAQELQSKAQAKNVRTKNFQAKGGQ